MSLLCVWIPQSTLLYFSHKSLYIVTLLNIINNGKKCGNFNCSLSRPTRHWGVNDFLYLFKSSLTKPKNFPEQNQIRQKSVQVKEIFSPDTKKEVEVKDRMVHFVKHRLIVQVLHMTVSHHQVEANGGKLAQRQLHSNGTDGNGMFPNGTIWNVPFAMFGA